jgi:predicted RNA binding protein YcfA (HicA-like mRNA interferase family)
MKIRGSRSKLARETALTAQAMGYTVEWTRGGHLRARHPATRAVVIFSNTSTSASGQKNALAALRRGVKNISPDS